MITVVCTVCNAALRVTGDMSEVDMLVGTRSEFWPDRYICFACGQPARSFLSPEVSAAVLAQLHIVDVNAQEAFAALNGLGVPDERTCCEEVVLPLFERQGIKVKGRQIRGARRYCVDELEFPDGTRLYLGASPQGALIYRVTKAHSYVEASDGNG